MGGRFEGPRGEFLESPDSYRWERAYSADGGKTWETNWIMEVARQA